MTTRIWSALAVAAIIVCGISFDLNRQARAVAHKPSRGVAAPSTGTRTFLDAPSGIAISYPAAWHRQPARTAEFSVAAPTGHAYISLDVPAMDWHPMFIPIGLVTSRYVDALRHAALPDAAVVESADLKVAGATARRVTARGHAPGTRAVGIDTAVVIAHGGQVYILSCDSDEAGATTARRALDAAVASVRWTK